MISFFSILTEEAKTSNDQDSKIKFKNNLNKDEIEEVIDKYIVVNGKKIKLTFAKTKNNIFHPIKIETKVKKRKKDANISKS